MGHSNAGRNNEPDTANDPPASSKSVQPEKNEPPVTDQSVIADKQTEHPEVHKNATNPNPSPPEKSLVDAVRKGERWMIILTSIIAGATALNVLVYWRESESSARQTAELARKAGEIVSSMNIALSDSRDAIFQAFDENEAALEASQRQSKAALDASIRASRMDQRAWVGPTLTLAAPYQEGSRRVFMKKNVRASWGVVVVNSGKTIAKSVHSLVSAKISAASEPFSATYDPDVRPHGIGVLQPGMHIIAYTGEARRPPEESDIVAIKSGIMVAYFFGKITYVDVFSTPHKTTFCLFLDRDLENFNACNAYNDAN